MEFQEVLRRRRMVRCYEQRAVPADLVDEILRSALRAPSAGFSQGWGFLALDDASDIAAFRRSVTPDEDADRWFAATFEAPLIIVPCSSKDAYLDRYAGPEKGHADRSDEWWPAPYWDIDTGFAALLILLKAVDLKLGACFFGLPVDRIDAFRKEFGVPDAFRPIGAISLGYPAEPASDVSAHRRPEAEVIHRGRWTVPTGR
jgi:nitroreductase